MTNAGAIDESTPADDWWTDAVTATPAARRRPSVASRHDERGDLPNQPRRSQQPGVDVFLFRCRPELGTSECVRLVKPRGPSKKRGATMNTAALQITLRTHPMSFLSVRITLPLTCGSASHDTTERSGTRERAAVPSGAAAG